MGRRLIGPSRNHITKSHQAIETNVKMLEVSPSEDTYIRDVSRKQVFDFTTHDLELTHGVTGGTFSTSIYKYDQNLHHDYIGVSSDKNIIIGSAANRFDQNRPLAARQSDFEDWGGTFDYSVINLNSPASRGVFHYDLGLNDDDQIVAASLTLNVARLLLHSFPSNYRPRAAKGTDTIGYTRGHYTLDRICRNDSQVTGLGARAASAGISAGSMEAMGWYRFKGGALSLSGINLNNFDDGEKWGQSGGSSASNKINPADTFDVTTRDNIGFSGPNIKRFIRETNSSEAVPDTPQIILNVTDLVKDAVTSRDSNFSFMIQRQNDTDGTTAEYVYIGPTIGPSGVSDSDDNPVDPIDPDGSIDSDDIGGAGGGISGNLVTLGTNTYFPNFTGALVLKEKPVLRISYVEGHRMVY